MVQKIIISNLIFAAIIFLILYPGCKFTKQGVSTISLNTLINAPEKIEIDGRGYSLEAALWRDFMPVTPPEGSPLMAAVKIIASDTLEFPAELNANHLWVIKGTQEIWETEFTGENKGGEKNVLEKSASNGPKWEIGIEVDVVTRLVNVRTGKNYLLRASKQKITRTD